MASGETGGFLELRCGNFCKCGGVRMGFVDQALSWALSFCRHAKALCRPCNWIWGSGGIGGGFGWRTAVSCTRRPTKWPARRNIPPTSVARKFCQLLRGIRACSMWEMKLQKHESEPWDSWMLCCSFFQRRWKKEQHNNGIL